MSDILEYKCPCCGGAIEFNSRLQKMKCPYCDTEFDLDTLKQFEEEEKKEAKDPRWDGDNVAQSSERIGDDGTFKTYVCDSCGGEIITDDNTAATSCPYCGNPVIVPKQFEGMLKPDLIIPFKLDKKQAEQKLKEHLKGKVLLPKLFRSENRIKEVKGIYVPFWLYSSEADAEIRCRATKIRTWRTGDYEYTETSHYLVSRGGQIAFDNVPADGSRKMADDLMGSIEPYQYEAAVPFEKAYLAGYLADKYDVSSEECAKRANKRMQESTERSFLDTINGYTSCVPEKTDIRLRQGKISYALLPVWVLSTKYKDEIYTFAMNGQTGKFVGNLPMDNETVWKIFGGVFAAVFTLVFGLTWLL